MGFWSNLFNGLFNGKKSQTTPEQAIVALSGMPAADAVVLIQGAVSLRPDAREVGDAIAAQLALSGTDMYGREVKDNVTGSNAKVEVSKYGRTGAGTTILPIYTDAASNETYLLLGRKANSDEYIMLGGYMNPVPFGKIPDKAAMQRYDMDLAHGARRELREESGLDIPADMKLQSLGVRSQYGVTNDPRLHTVVEDYLVDFGKRDAAPAVKAADDIAEVRWVKASDLKKNASMSAQAYGSGQSRYSVAVEGKSFRLRDDHGEVIEAALSRVREKANSHELQAIMDRAGQSFAERAKQSKSQTVGAAR